MLVGVGVGLAAAPNRSFHREERRTATKCGGSALGADRGDFFPSGARSAVTIGHWAATDGRRIVSLGKGCDCGTSRLSPQSGLTDTL